MLASPSVRLEWRDMEVDTADSSASSSQASQASSDSESMSDAFLTHKISKFDTLAGLAIKYGVQLADVKRFNGLLSDTAIYGRDTVLIPLRAFPIGEEVQLIFAQIAAGIGRDPVLNADSTMHPASASAARIARALHLVSVEQASPRSDLPGNLPWWCQCGACSEDSDGAYLCRRMASTDSGPGHVELVEMSLAQAMATHSHSEAHGPARLHEQLRRRQHGKPAGADDGGDAYRAHAHGSRALVLAQEPSSRAVPPASAAFLSSLGKAMQCAASQGVKGHSD